MPQIGASLALGACATTAVVLAKTGDVKEDAPVQDKAPAVKDVVLTDSEEEVLDEMIARTVEDVLSISSSEENRESMMLDADEAVAVEAEAVDEPAVAVSLDRRGRVPQAGEGGRAEQITRKLEKLEN
jgi:hypothetical protein